MKPISESRALSKLAVVRAAFTEQIRGRYEHRARPCSECSTPGACCLDAHFVNVRITRLEAAAILKSLERLDPETRSAVLRRVEAAIKKYGLEDPVEPSLQTYACPLFESGIGCLVHTTAKPFPCIAHACYERKEDLPPDALLAEREAEVESLNRRVFGTCIPLALPVAMKRYSPPFLSSNANAIPESSQPTT